MGRMGGVLHDTIGFAGASCKENIQDGGERGTDDLCSCKSANKGWSWASYTVDCWCGRVDMSSSELQSWMMVFIDALWVIKYAAGVKTHKQCRFTQQSSQQRRTLSSERGRERENNISGRSL